MTDLARVPGASLAVPVPLSEGARARMRDGVPENTRRAYRRWQARWLAWCDEHDRNPLPADDVTLAEFVNGLADENLARSTILQARSAVRTAHRLAGYPERPDLNASDLVLRGYTRARSRQGLRPKQAPPVTTDVLRRMIQTLDPARLGDVRDGLLLTLGWGMFARRSELAGLHLEDITEDIGPEGLPLGLRCWIRVAKTDKTGEGQYADVVRQADDDLDAITHLRRWRRHLTDRNVPLTGPVLRTVDRHGNLGPPTGMSDEAVSLAVRRVAKAAGLDHADTYTGHSLRAGAATSALASGQATLQGVCEAGRWVPGSQAVALYSRQQTGWRNHPLRSPDQRR